MTQKPPRPNPPQFTVFHLDSQHRDLTLAAALKALKPEWSWGQTRAAISGRHVQVNGNLCLDESRRLTEKDVIKLWREALAKPAGADDVKFAYVDEHLVIVEKPPGVNSVRHREERVTKGSRKQTQPTLEDLVPMALAKHLGLKVNPSRQPRNSSPKRRNIPWQTSRKNAPALPLVFPVHRLDRDTSGLMVFARTRIAEQKLIKLFRDHRIERQYWAVAIGEVESQTIESVLVRDRGDGIRGSHSGPSVPEDGQNAITHLKVLEKLSGFTVLQCKLETGRTHQIRIHLSELGHPLCGDKVYGRTRDGRTIEDRSNAPRHALHSERIVFTHPITRESIDLRMRLPADLARWFSKLRSIASRTPPASDNSAD